MREQDKSLYPLYPSNTLAPSDDLAPSNVLDITCKESGKVLGRMNDKGLILYCGACKEPHVIPFLELIRLFEEITRT